MKKQHYGNHGMHDVVQNLSPLQKIKRLSLRRLCRSSSTCSLANYKTNSSQQPSRRQQKKVLQKKNWKKSRSEAQTDFADWNSRSVCAQSSRRVSLISRNKFTTSIKRFAIWDLENRTARKTENVERNTRYILNKKYSENFGKNFSKYLRSNPTNSSCQTFAKSTVRNGELVMDHAATAESREFSHEELCRLLSYLEGEVQARDIVIATFKSEKAKQLLFEARYGRLVGYDPFAALQRDSKLLGNEEEDEGAVSQMYDSQLSHLERLISAQKRYHSRYKQVLAATERRHARILRELDEQKKRSETSVAQGDEVFAFLEDERARLRQQLEYERKENGKVQRNVEKLEKKLDDEKERHKAMVLFLINERKQMLVKMHELRIHCEHGDRQEGMLLAEMRKEVGSLRGERDQLKSALNTAREEITILKENVRQKELMYNLMRTSGTTSASANNIRTCADGSLVLANKSASASLPPPKGSTGMLPPATPDSRHGARMRLSSSSSFPSGERNTPSRVPLPSINFHRPSTSPSTSATSSPTKKHPGSPSKVDSHNNATYKLSKNSAPGSCDRNRTVRLLRVSKKDVPFVTEPEIQQLGAAIDSLNTKTTRRSSSLPRNGVVANASNNSLRKQPPAQKPNKPEKRSGIFRAFGVSSKNDKNS